MQVLAPWRGRRHLGRPAWPPFALPLAALMALAAALAWPAAAAAHGLTGRAYLPVPAWLFAWAAGLVLIVSFFVLGRLWSTPQLEPPRPRRLAGLPRWLDPLCGAIGVAGFALVVVSGVLGNQIPTANLAPTAVFVLFWVGVPVLSVLFGDVFRAFNPWRALARAGAWVAHRAGREPRGPRDYPSRLGRWPAAAGVFCFAWLELVLVDKDHPETLAVLAVGYALVQLVGMAWFGTERWTERGDGFAVAFNLFARCGVLEYRDGAVWRRRPLSGLTVVAPLPGTVALLATMIGTTSFDGFMNGPIWRSAAPSVERWFRHRGLGGTTSLELTFTLGMLACVLICVALYELGIVGMQLAGGDTGLGVRFVHSLAPIAFGYMLAHYFSLLVTQGQAAWYLMSDPLGTGANVFGTAGFQIDYGILSGAVIWYVQVLALVGGHVSGLALAHDRALVVYGNSEEAVDSQRWMLVVMVTFTCLGLWLLSAVNT